MECSERTAINPENTDTGIYGRLAQMAERSLSMREAPGSIPGLSSTALRVGGLYSSVGQSARLVSARSGVRTSLEARDFFCRSFINLKKLKRVRAKEDVTITLARTLT